MLLMLIIPPKFFFNLVAQSMPELPSLVRSANSFTDSSKKQTMISGFEAIVYPLVPRRELCTFNPSAPLLIWLQFDV